ncbi:MAG: hypothetical protein WKF75_10095 [Singulisphaera sp.]
MTSTRWIIRGVQTIRSISRRRPWLFERIRRPPSRWASLKANDAPIISLS